MTTSQDIELNNVGRLAYKKKHFFLGSGSGVSYWLTGVALIKAEKFYKTLGRCSISSYHSSPSVSCAAQVQKQPDPHINSKVGGLSWKIYDVAGPIMIGQRDLRER